jgi:PAS domain S-box-containing protein
MTRPARSIRHKLNRLLAVTTLMALVIAGIALALVDVRSRATTIREDMVTQADILALSSRAALAFDDKRVGAENLSVLRAKADVVAAALYNADGAVFASYRAQGDAAVPPRPARDGATFDRDYIRVARPIFSNDERIGTVYIQARHELLARVLGYLGVLAIVLGASLGSALLLSNRLLARVTGPLLAIGNVARRVKEGHFDQRAPRTSEDEVGELADAFNAMLDELAQRERTREAALDALRVSDERYQLAVRGSSAGLWDWDMRTDTMLFSPRLRALLGYDASEFPDVRSSLTNIVHEDDRDATRQALGDHLQYDEPYSVEARLRLKSGEWRWFHITGMAQKDARGEPFRMAGSVIDVTERKNAEQVLHEANRAKDEFIATLAHELRNPLAPIRTGLDILRVDGGKGPASTRARETMERQLGHMIRLIDDLLDISRINSGKIRLEKSRMRLAAALESAVEASRPALDARGHELAVEMPAHDVELIADGTRIAQTVGNLLLNAAKYTPPGGHVRLKAWQDGAWAVIEVRDDGVGIPPHMLDTIFTLFTQVSRTLERAQGGLGIGLYLVRSLVQLHGGTVTATSEGTGRGSTFTVRLPCLVGGADDDAAPAGEQQVTGPAGLKVLVVDDNVDAAETLCTVLEMTGRTALAAYDGESVLAAAREFAPDVVLLDIGLPKMSGYDVARQLRADERFARVMIVAVTGWGADADRRRSSEAGFDAHLTKPVDLQSLEPLLARLAARPAAPLGAPAPHPGQ